MSKLAPPKYISLIAAALLASFAIALAVLPSRSAEAVSAGNVSQVHDSTGNSGTIVKNNFVEPLNLAAPVPDVLAAWGFESVTTTGTATTPVITGSAAADSGVLTAGSSFTGLHASAATIWSNFAGNASAKSFSADHCGIGDYYQFSFSTSGYSAISITWDQTGSGTGPRDFKVQYSTNGTTFTNASGTNSTYAVTAQTWSSGGSPNLASRRTLDLSSVSALDNQSTVYIRLVVTSTTSISGGTIGTGGTQRVDNFTVNGTSTAATPTPTPTATPTPTPTPTPMPTPTPTPNPGVAGTVVISQVYGGGGNASATYLNDYVELFNRSASTVNIGNWSVQYSSATGTGLFSSNVGTLSGSLAPGQYSLVKLGSGGTTGVALPTEDNSATGINMAAGAGKVVLVDTSAGLACNGNSTACSASDAAHIMDLVGYGNANFFEGAGAASGPSNNTTSIFRAVGGCTDTNNNGSDFSTGTPSPRNSGSTFNVCAVSTPTPTPTPTPSPSPTPTPAPFNPAIKISQVYGGGGNSGSTYTNDFIELYNTGSLPIDITGWSVQYTGATTAFAPQTTPTPPGVATPLTTTLSGTIQPGHYYLIKESQGAGGTTSLPAADLTGGILVGSTAGKVALVASSSVLVGGTAGDCPTDPLIVDFVGYGISPTTATCSETSPTVTLTNTTAAIRKNNGCTDTDNNSNDFLIDGPIPRNSLLPAHGCGADPTQLFGQGLATPDYLLPSSNTLLTINVSPASISPSTGIAVSADLTSIGGNAPQQFYDDGTHGDQMAGDNVFSYLQTVGAFIPTGVKNIVANITDAQARSAPAPITITVQSPTCGVERWSVKTGGDPDAANVDLNNPVPTTIANLRSLTPPATPPDNARVAGETTVYVIRATMTLYKLESDVDYHIVVQDENGNTMVTEIPCPCCVAGGSPFAAGIANARHEFDARLTAATFFQSVSIPVQITGVGFFDFIHGQTGVAPNGIELHPILDIKFLSNTTTTLVSNANPSQYGQSVQFTTTVASAGANIPTGNVTFSDGATVVSSSTLNGSGQASFSTTSLSVGSHSITASYPGDSNSLPSASSVLTQVVNKADQFINFGALAGKTFGDANFSVSATASSGLPVSFSIVSGPATISGSTVHITGAGSVTVRASQAGDGNYNAAPDVDQSFEVAKAAQGITFAALSNKTYGDAPFTVAATGGGSGNPVTFGASGNCTLSGASGSTITITGAGSCTVTASQTGNANYIAAPDVSRSFAINQATATITVNGYSGVYDGNAHGATGSATGVNGEDLTSLLNLGASFTDVPGGTAHWTFAGNTNYAPATGDAAITISKASSTTTVTCPASETYTGAALTPCSVTVTGANLSLTPAANYVNNTNAGTATASYTYAGDPNHDGSSDSKNFEISKANATISVTPYSVTYDGNPHTATGTAKGVNGESLSGLDLSGTMHTNAGTYNGDSWTFTDVTGNYNNTSGAVDDSIGKASASITVNGYSGIYDGTAHGATGSAAGVNGENLNSLLSLGATFTNVPGGTAHWTFAGNTNYAPSNGDATITITKATPTIDWNNPANIVYGTLLSSTQLNATANVSGTFSYTPVSGTLLNAGSNQPLLASFTPTDTTNYNATSKNVQINVLKATPSFSNLSSPIITYGAATTNLAGKISFGSFIPTGSVAITLNSVTQNAAIQAGGNFSSAFATGSLAASSYSIAYSYGGDSNFNSANGSATLTVGYGIVPLYDQTQVHQSGSTIPIKLEITNASGNNLSSSNLSVTAVSVSLVSATVSGPPANDAGNANPDSNFRFDNNSYIFNLQTTGLATGVYNLYFRVGADPTLHTVQFQIK